MEQKVLPLSLEKPAKEKSAKVSYNSRHSSLDRLNQSQEVGNWEMDYKGLFSERLDLYKLTTFSPNKLLPLHSWYPYLQGFSAQLVELLLDHFKADKTHKVLDPWCGVGTTNLSCAQKGIYSFGIDISPLAIFIAKTKLNGIPSEYDLRNTIHRLQSRLASAHLIVKSSKFDIVNRCIPAETLSKLDFLKIAIRRIRREKLKNLLFLALLISLEQLSTLQKDGAHYKFRYEPKRKDVWPLFNEILNWMSNSGELFRRSFKVVSKKADIRVGDSRSLEGILSKSINFVITSPPYLNRDNYIAQNKLELMFGDFVKDFSDYRKLTHSTLRSHVEAFSEKFKDKVKVPQLNNYLQILWERRDMLNNNQVISMTEGYFIDLNISLKEIYRVLKRGGRVALVVGNSCWADVLIEVDKMIVEIAYKLGFKPEAIWVTRYKLNSAQQIASYGKRMLRESIVFLKKP